RDADSMSGILGLQSIPVLNRIFTSRQRVKDESEILLSITPHLVRAPKITARDLEATLIGTRELVRVNSAIPALGVPEDQVAPAVGQSPAPGPSPTPAPSPSPSPGAPAPGSVSPPAPPPGAPPV